jgi:Co/Zn/Cd efflux system component
MWRAGTALVKGMSMGLFGAWVLIATTISTLQNVPPHAMTMGAVGCLALIANVGVAVMLYQFREGDANMRSVWLCTRNDAIGNAAVMVAAFGVFGTGTTWPDIAVASIMAILALKAASVTIRTAITELKQAVAPPVEAHANHGH